MSFILCSRSYIIVVRSNDGGDGDVAGSGVVGGDDIYIMMNCVCVCLSRKMITSSWESPVTTCNHP